MHFSSTLQGALLASLILIPMPALAATDAAVATGSVPVRHISVNVALFPPLEFASEFEGRVSPRLGLNIIGGRTYGLDGLEMGGVFNMKDGYVNGTQLAGAFNLAGGPVNYFQAAGIANLVAGPVSGMQAAGAANLVSGDTSGFQAAGGANLVSGDTRGLQAAGVLNIAGGRVSGFQAAGGVNVAGGSFDGLQAAGLVNVAQGSLRGAQAAGLVNTVAGNAAGAQMGLLNVAGGRVDGAQIGLVNIADDLDGVPVGIFSYVRKGRLEAQALYENNGFTQIAVNSGGLGAYSIASVGYRSETGAPLYALQLGLGFNRELGNGFYNQFELLSGNVMLTPDSFRNSGVLQTLRESIGFRLAPHLAAKVGVSLNVLSAASLANNPLTNSPLYSSANVQVWPGYFAALEF
ncbi:hypothetical protein J7643_06395 [bacterium]|nr:hypothetical protein [bacterium]